MKRNTASILTIGALLGFVAGIFVSGFDAGYREIVSNQYLHYEMYRLIAYIVFASLFELLAAIVAGAVLLLIAVRVVERLVSPRGRGIAPRSRKWIPILVACSLVLLAAGLAVGHFVLRRSVAHLVSALIGTGVSAACALLVWLTTRILSRGRGEALLRAVARQGYLGVTAAVLVVALAVANAGFWIFDRATSPAGPNIVVIVIDTLRYDHLGCSGYERDTSPLIDELAREGVVFENAYASAPWTKPSVASLFSSLHPNQHLALNLRHAMPARTTVLAEMLRNAGYRTLFLSGQNAFLSKKYHLHHGFDTYFNGGRDAGKLTRRALAGIGNAGGQRFFAYIHYMDVHLPYGTNEFNYLFAPEQEDSSFRPGRIHHRRVKRAMLAGELTAEDRAYIEALYDGQIRYVDRHVGKIVEWLKEEGLYEETLLVITSDHGEEFWDHSNFEHGHSMYQELVHVPLIAVGNGLGHAVVERPVRLVDLLPTLLELTGIEPVDFHPEGVALPVVGGARGPGEEQPVFVMNTCYGPERYGLISGGRKLIFNTHDRSGGKGKFRGYPSRDELELYDLAADPREQVNLADDEGQAEELERLKQMLGALIKQQSPFEKLQIKIDEETEEQLRALGYL